MTYQNGIGDLDDLEVSIVENNGAHKLTIARGAYFLGGSPPEEHYLFGDNETAVSVSVPAGTSEVMLPSATPNRPVRVVVDYAPLTRVPSLPLRESCTAEADGADVVVRLGLIPYDDAVFSVYNISQGLVASYVGVDQDVVLTDTTCVGDTLHVVYNPDNAFALYDDDVQQTVRICCSGGLATITYQDPDSLLRDTGVDVNPVTQVVDSSVTGGAISGFVTLAETPADTSSATLISGAGLVGDFGYGYDLYDRFEVLITPNAVELPLSPYIGAQLLDGGAQGNGWTRSTETMKWVLQYDLDPPSDITATELETTIWPNVAGRLGMTIPPSALAVPGGACTLSLAIDDEELGSIELIPEVVNQRDWVYVHALIGVEEVSGVLWWLCAAWVEDSTGRVSGIPVSWYRSNDLATELIAGPATPSEFPNVSVIRTKELPAGEFVSAVATIGYSNIASIPILVPDI